MKYILLDTNLLIYREDKQNIKKSVITLSRYLTDSDDYKTLIHPVSLEEAEGYNDQANKEVFLAKLGAYNVLLNPPKVTSKFTEIVGGGKRKNDSRDNEILYALYRDCVSYLITNDIKLIKKAKRVGLENRTISIEKALELFKPEISTNETVFQYIEEKKLYEIELNNTFFDSLRDDYYEFDKWYKDKTLNGKNAWVSYDDDGNICSFMMIKDEDETEKYLDFKKKLEHGKRIKLSTFKVDSRGMLLGERFIKMIIDIALNRRIEELYVTVFSKHLYLIELLSEYGFKEYSTKSTRIGNGEWREELVLVKSLRKNKEEYPFINAEDKQVFLIPILPKFHRRLFPESEGNYQFDFLDYKGTKSESNSIKKAYICNANIRKIQEGDIVCFYESTSTKAITSVGVVDKFGFDFENIEDLKIMIRKRTVYGDNEINQIYRDATIAILFKYCFKVSPYVTFDFLLENSIVKGSIQTISSVDRPVIKILLDSLDPDENYFVGK